MSSCATDLISFFDTLVEASPEDFVWHDRPKSIAHTKYFPFLSLYNPIAPPQIAIFTPSLLKNAALNAQPPIVPIGILTNDMAPSADLPATGILSSPYDAQSVFEILSPQMCYLFNKKQNYHGTFVEVYDRGILLIGKSGIGKSRTALHLIEKGHKLIADDAPEFIRVHPNLLIGTCPETISGLLEIRGLGISQLSTLFGAKAVKKKKKLDLVVKLVKNHTMTHTKSIARLKPEYHRFELLGVTVPAITLACSADQNIANLIEIAALEKQTSQVFCTASNHTSPLRKEKSPCDY